MADGEQSDDDGEEMRDIEQMAANCEHATSSDGPRKVQLVNGE